MAKIQEYKSFLVNGSKELKDPNNLSNIASINNACIIRNQYVSLNGTNSYISFPNVTAYASLTNKLQIELTFNTFDVDSKIFVLDKDGLFNLQVQENKIIFALETNLGTITYESRFQTVNINEWIYILITVNLLTSTVEIYLNNSLKSFFSTTGALGTSLGISSDLLIAGAKTGITNSGTVEHGLDYLSISNTVFTSPERSNKYTLMNKYIAYKYNLYAIQDYIEAPVISLSGSSSGSTYNSIGIEWDSVPNATSYSLYVSEDDFLNYINNYDPAIITGNNQLIIGLDQVTEYKIKMTASGTNNIPSPYSNILAVLTDLTPPVAMAASVIQSGSFYANWNSVSDVTGYEFDLATDIGFTSYVSGSESLNVGNVTTWLNSNLDSDEFYYYRVRATGGTNTSDSSNIITTLTLLPAPIAEEATLVTTTTFTANWSVPIMGYTATGYNLTVLDDNDDPLPSYDALDVGNVLSYNITGLVKETNYSYIVSAYSPNQTSVDSNEISLTTAPETRLFFSQTLIFYDNSKYPNIYKADIENISVTPVYSATPSYGSASGPFYSPNYDPVNEYMYFTQYPNNIYRIKLDGSNLSNVSNIADGNYCGHVQIAPNGNKIAYLVTTVNNNQKLGPGVINISTVDGLSTTSTGISAYSVDFNLTSDKILASIGNDISLYNLDGTGKVTISTENALEAFYSPDRTKIIYRKAISGYSQIFLMDADGSNVTQLTTSAIDKYNACFNPFMTKIAFNTDYNNYNGGYSYGWDNIRFLEYPVIDPSTYTTMASYSGVNGSVTGGVINNSWKNI